MLHAVKALLAKEVAHKSATVSVAGDKQDRMFASSDCALFISRKMLKVED